MKIEAENAGGQRGYGFQMRHGEIGSYDDFKGAKKIRFDLFLDDSEKPGNLGTFRIKVHADKVISQRFAYVKGPNAIEMDLTGIDTAGISQIQFKFDDLSGKITLYIDNFRIVRLI